MQVITSLSEYNACAYCVTPPIKMRVTPHAALHGITRVSSVLPACVERLQLPAPCILASHVWTISVVAAVCFAPIAEGAMGITYQPPRSRAEMRERTLSEFLVEPPVRKAACLMVLLHGVARVAIDVALEQPAFVIVFRACLFSLCTLTVAYDVRAHTTLHMRLAVVCAALTAIEEARMARMHGAFVRVHAAFNALALALYVRTRAGWIERGFIGSAGAMYYYPAVA